MITTANGFKVFNFRKVIREHTNVPYGFHVETWGVVDREKKTIELYTSEYLSQNSWTVNHDDNEIRFAPSPWSELCWTKDLRAQLEEVEA